MLDFMGVGGGGKKGKVEDKAVFIARPPFGQNDIAKLSNG
jgi:hypothetical protein